MTAPSPPLISRYHVGILSLQPRDKAAMLGVSTIEFFLEEFTRNLESLVPTREKSFCS